MIVVKLLDRYQHYSAGELAGFPDRIAKSLISNGKAVEYGNPKVRNRAVVTDGVEGNEAPPRRQRPEPEKAKDKGKQEKDGKEDQKEAGASSDQK